MVWGDFLRMLADDGVTLDEIEYDGTTTDGRRRVRHMLCRFTDGKALAYDLTYPSMDATVTKWTIRRVANRLRLPVDKYIMPH